MISPQDFDLLSAYLDGELDAAQAQALEQRLQQDEALMREWLGLQAVVNALHALPTRPAPRDFTLTPAQARQARPPVRLLARRGWMVSLASVAMVVMVIGVGVLLNRAPATPQAVLVANAPTPMSTTPDMGARSAPPALADELETDVPDADTALSDDVLSDDVLSDDVLSDDALSDDALQTQENPGGIAEEAVVLEEAPETEALELAPETEALELAEQMPSQAGAGARGAIVPPPTTSPSMQTFMGSADENAETGADADMPAEAETFSIAPATSPDMSAPQAMPPATRPATTLLEALIAVLLRWLLLLLPM